MGAVKAGLLATASSRREAALIAAIPGVTLGSGRGGLSREADQPGEHHE
jgi:hypothetical protein